MGGQMSKTGLDIKSPFGQTPFGIAGGQKARFTGPVSRGFGFQGGPKFERRLSTALEQGSPLASVISQVRDLVPGSLARSQEIGADIAGRAPAAFGALQGQIDQFLQALPNFQRAAGGEVGRAEQRAEDVAAPGRSAALFQQFAQPALQMARQEAAGRGVTGTGGAQAGTEGLLQDLTREFIASQGAEQGAAGQALQQALGGAAAMGQAGLGPAQMGLEALPQLGALLGAEFGIPMGQAQSVLGLLQGAQAPAFDLLRAVAPVAGTKGFSMGK